jgi:MerR family transcriptional regulator, light-induced transcriptional regulator
MAIAFFMFFDMAKAPTYTIKYVAHRTGLKPYLIRSWEARYQAVCPRRASNQRRCFTDSDIERLRLLKRAVDQGHPISAVANLSEKDLERLLNKGGAATLAKGASRDAAIAPPSLHSDPGQVVDAALFHINRLDAASLETVLNDAAVEMPRQAFLQQVVLSIFDKIGDLWRSGKMKIVGEHLASVVVRSILWDMLRNADVSKAAPRIVVATPVGHWHEFGALTTALAASESGWRAAYFGPNLPAEELAYAVRRLKARALALSLCQRIKDNRLAPELRKLRRLVGSRLPIFVGGPGADMVPVRKLRCGVLVAQDLGEFRKRLERLGEESFDHSR